MVGKAALRDRWSGAIKALSGLRGGTEFGMCEKRRKGSGGGWRGCGRAMMLSEADISNDEMSLAFTLKSDLK